MSECKHGKAAYARCTECEDEFANPAPFARDMTKRERFAMAAMQGFCAVTAYRDVNPDTLAAWSVEQADALLAALEAK